MADPNLHNDCHMSTIDSCINYPPLEKRTIAQVRFREWKVVHTMNTK